MKLVVDTNVVIAALIKDGICRYLLTHFDGELYTVKLLDKELEKYREYVTKKAGISKEMMQKILQLTYDKMIFLDDALIEQHMEQAKKVIAKYDNDDVPFIAAALAIQADIWSDDDHFKQQTQIKVWTTEELVKRLKKQQIL